MFLTGVALASVLLCCCVCWRTYLGAWCFLTQPCPQSSSAAKHVPELQQIPLVPPGCQWPPVEGKQGRIWCFVQIMKIKMMLFGAQIHHSRAGEPSLGFFKSSFHRLMRSHSA